MREQLSVRLISECGALLRWFLPRWAAADNPSMCGLLWPAGYLRVWWGDCHVSPVDTAVCQSYLKLPTARPTTVFTAARLLMEQLAYKLLIALQPYLPQHFSAKKWRGVYICILYMLKVSTCICEGRGAYYSPVTHITVFVSCII